MAAKPCIEKIGIPKEMKDYILRQREEHAKNGLNEKEADLLSAKILQEKALDELHNVYHQLGVGGYGERITETAKKPITESTKNKNGLQFDKDNKDKFYITKDGKYRVFPQDLEMVVRDKETNDKVSKAVEKRALREYAENFDFTHGKEATEVPEDVKDNTESLKHIIKTSENPYQVAEIYVNEEPQTQSLTDKEVMIADYGVQIHEDSFSRFSDKNLLTPEIKKAYIVKDKDINTPAKRSQLGIDTQAKEISDHYGVEVTPQDIVDFIERFPGGVKDALKLTDSEVSIAAQERFKELTGLKLNHELAEKVINQKFDLLTKKEQELAQKDYETEQQLTDDYWKAFKETDGFTKESPVSEVKQTEATQKVDNGKTATAANGKSVSANAAESKKQGSETPISESTNTTGQSDAASGTTIPPVEPPPLTTEEKLNPENPETVLSFEGLQEIADEHGLDAITARERKADEKLVSDAQGTITKWVNDKTYPEKIEKLVQSALSSEVLTDESRIILQQHIANVRNAANEAKAEFGITSKEYDEKLRELKRLNRAGNLTRSAAGAALRVPSNLGSIVRYDVADMMTAKMESLNVEELTDKQKEDINEQSQKIESLSKDADEKMTAYENAIAGYKAEIELLKSQKDIKASKNTPAKRNAVKTENDFKAERQTLKEKLAKQWQQYKDAGNKLGIASDGGGESFVISAKMAKTIGEIVKSHVEEIGANLKEVVGRVYEEIKDIFPHVTENDIRDVISGKYNEPQKTKNQLQIDLKDIQDEQKLINKLEALESGIVPVSEKAKVERNKNIKDLRDKISKIRKDQPIPDLKKLQEIKKRNEKREQDIREKIANSDFVKTETNQYAENERLRKLFPKEYKEAYDAIAAKEDAKHDFELGLFKDERSRRSVGKKFVNTAQDIIGTVKALRAGIDFSATLIQNVVPIISHPVAGLKSIIHSFGDFGSAKKFERDIAALHDSPYWPLIEASGLDVTEPKSLNAKNKEEYFNRNLLEKDIVIKGKRYNIGKYTTAPFERQFTSLGNHIRVSGFLRMAGKLEQDGYTFSSHPKKFKDLAELLNTQTGRGTLPDFIKKSTEAVNTVIWSPRLMASRLNLLGIGDVGNALVGREGFYKRLDPQIRKKAALDFVKFVGGVLGVYAIASYSMGATSDLDPLSPTFGDIKDDNGHKSYNMFGGFSQYVKLAAILAMGEREAGKGHKIEDITDQKGKSRLDLLLKFGRGKLTPLASAAASFADNKDYLGRPVDKKQELLNLVTPLSLSGIPDDLKRDGAISAITNGLISMTGVNVKDDRDYQKPKKK